ncbi:E3 ubiquitin-protein ligase TRIM35 isoform X2 [Manacus candei]|uniref:E3 ubiquitin-protein ligase TRIM35 isoform X2 n=1 Tax=Manacus candei TaxID=415023 RepID=UPI0022267F75|nr:E3 ubiquitin-protein ligase TRIM35 isoform X2 [Manacus candei]
MSREPERSPPHCPLRRRCCCRNCRDPPDSSMEDTRGDPRPSRGPAGASSASGATLKEELLCPICYEPFREAVTLGCGHNFCRGCVRRSWEQRLRSCPVCKESSARDELRLNHTLNNLVEMILKEGERGEEEEEEEEEKGRKGKRAALCPLHGEEAKFFCLEDKELACGSCRSSAGHEGHKVRPVREAAADFRAKLVNMESSLREKAKDFGVVRRSYKSIAKHNKTEAERLERQVKREFRKLHEFLWNEEKALLAQLQEEIQQKQELIQEKVEQLERENQALLGEARQLQADLKQDDHTFLMSHKNRKRRIAWTAEEPEAVPAGLLLDVPKYLGSLQFNVWKKMLGSVTAVPFSFDPGSAAGWLSVSDDLSSVSNRGFQLSVENPERFTSAPCILGSRGFSSGFHAWEVDLGGVDNWRVGVARPREGTRWSFHHDSRSGFWFLYRLPGKDECRASNAARSEAGAPGAAVRRLRVELDCDEGELSFYAADPRRHIYTFHEKFGGAVFPYFYVGGDGGAARGESQAEALRICPLRVRVHEDIPD